MEDRKSDTIAVNGATTGTSHHNLKEAAVAAAILVAPLVTLIDPVSFGYWSRETLTGFPQLRSSIQKGWSQHYFEWSKK